MIELSPVAQAVLDAANRRPKYGCHGTWIADALRAAANRLVLDPGANSAGGALLSCKDQLHDIANELENYNV